MKAKSKNYELLAAFLGLLALFQILYLITFVPPPRLGGEKILLIKIMFNLAGVISLMAIGVGVSLMFGSKWKPFPIFAVLLSSLYLIWFSPVFLGIVKFR